METVEVAYALVKEHALCDSCLGRQFAMLGHGLTNEKRGETLKLSCIIEGSRLLNEGNPEGREILMSIAINGFSDIAVETLKTHGTEFVKHDLKCYLCGGAFEQIDGLAGQAVSELSKYEFDSFLVGIKASAEIEDKEDELRSKFSMKWSENIRNEFSREIGKRIFSRTGKIVELRRPNVLVVVNPFKGTVSLDVYSLFVCGRYRKLVRGISQSKWLCRECRGRGCPRCDGKGRMYADSIEELIGNPLLEMADGRGIKLHASGREDVDVRTLGSGRPFVVEVKSPRLRKIDLGKLEEMINQKANGKIEVIDLNFSSKEEVVKLKEGEKSVKVYRAIVEFEKALSDEDLLKTEGLNNILINQETPLRVAHRRALKIRKRYLYEMKLKRLKPNLVEMWIRCQGGLYIKELIHGDEGRTKPSVTEVVGVPAKCIELDVMKVELED